MTNHWFFKAHNSPFHPTAWSVVSTFHHLYNQTLRARRLLFTSLLSLLTILLFFPLLVNLQSHHKKSLNVDQPATEIPPPSSSPLSTPVVASVSQVLVS